jgi:acetyl esterase/lipase
VNYAPLIESALAVKHIRDHADDYFVDPDYVFIMGFSAGGHCAAMCGTLWNHPAVREALGIDRGEAPEGINRPTATVLCYPVITGGPFAHRGSIDNLCGYPSAGTEGADRFSLELHVDKTTSPAFIWHTFNDNGVPVQNTLLYATAMAAAGVPFEYHVYPDGVHGLSLCNRETSVGNPALDSPVCAGWLKEAIRYVKEF